MCMMMMGLVGAGISAMGAAQASEAQAQAYTQKGMEYQAQSQLDQTQAVTTQQAGQQKQRLKAEQGDALVGKQIAGYSAGGVRIDSGSPLTTITDSQRENALDIAAIKYNTDIDTDNKMYSARVNNFNAASAFDAAETQHNATFLAAVSPLVGAVGKIGGSQGGFGSLSDVGGGGGAGGIGSGLSSLGLGF